mmetsp:Transcript_64781/g.211095  ORF Transcript_64781/g.211095 Transcript_64781/m.211095 type:complete len:280 (-) Transcript_64781:324-1163(-)
MPPLGSRPAGSARSSPRRRPRSSAVRLARGPGRGRRRRGRTPFGRPSRGSSQRFASSAHPAHPSPSNLSRFWMPTLRSRTSGSTQGWLSRGRKRATRRALSAASRRRPPRRPISRRPPTPPGSLVPCPRRKSRNPSPHHPLLQSRDCPYCTFRAARTLPPAAAPHAVRAAVHAAAPRRRGASRAPNQALTSGSMSHGARSPPHPQPHPRLLACHRCCPPDLLQSRDCCYCNFRAAQTLPPAAAPLAVEAVEAAAPAGSNRARIPKCAPPGDPGAGMPRL